MRSGNGKRRQWILSLYICIASLVKDVRLNSVIKRFLKINSDFGKKTIFKKFIEKNPSET